MPSSQKIQIWLKPNCRGPSNDHSCTVWFQLSKWFQRISVLKHFPIGSNVNLSQEKKHFEFIGPKYLKFVENHPMNIHVQFGFNHIWLEVFCSDMKFKMAATARLSLTLNPMNFFFQNASSLKPLGQLKPNCPGMIIGRSSTKYLLSKWFQRRSILKKHSHRVQC
jgi:hypothetical protein